MTKRNQAVLYLLCTAIFWSTGGVGIKTVDWNPLAVAGVRSLLAAVVIGVAFRKEKSSFSPIVWGGALAYCVTMVLFVIATKLTTAANAILLQYTAPVYVALFSGRLLHEPASRRDWITIFCVFGGMIFFFLDKVSMNGMIGNLCAVASGVGFAFVFIFMRWQKDGSTYSSVFLGNLLTFLVSIPFLTDLSWSWQNELGMAYLGFIQLGVAYVLYTLAMRYVKALDAILITTLEPILNPIWVFLFLGEMPGNYALFGGAIVIGAIVIHGWLGQKAQPK